MEYSGQTDVLKSHNINWIVDFYFSKGTIRLFWGVGESLFRDAFWIPKFFYVTRYRPDLLCTKIAELFLTVCFQGNDKKSGSYWMSKLNNSFHSHCTQNLQPYHIPQYILVTWDFTYLVMWSFACGQIKGIVEAGNYHTSPCTPLHLRSQTF